MNALHVLATVMTGMVVLMCFYGSWVELRRGNKRRSIGLGILASAILINRLGDSVEETAALRGSWPVTAVRCLGFGLGIVGICFLFLAERRNQS